VTARVCDTETEWHFTQERRISAGHAHSAEIIADEKHKFVSSGDELIALQQWRARTSVSICFNCLEQMPIVGRIDRPKIDTHASRWSTYGRVQHMSREAPHGIPPFPFWVRLPMTMQGVESAAGIFTPLIFLRARTAAAALDSGPTFHILKRRMAHPVRKGIGEINSRSVCVNVSGLGDLPHG
jgi:hypothetical protein